jgi:multiple sugar transport system permease protein
MSNWWLYVILTVALVAVISPFVWMVLGSFKTQGELLQSPPTWWPQKATMDNYTQLFSRLNFKQYFFNSTVVAVVVTAGNLLF